MPLLHPPFRLFLCVLVGAWIKNANATCTCQHGSNEAMTKDQHDSAIEEAANNGSINALKRLLQKRKLGSLDSHDEEEGDGEEDE